MKPTYSEVANQIKNALVVLTSNGDLPSDMTTLDVTFIEDILKKNDVECPYENALHYLCDSDELSVKEQVKLIEKQVEIDGDIFIDNVEGVIVWEKLEWSFTCDSFLDQIGL